MVRCPQCDATNRESARFCAECATPLGAACASCGHGIDPRAKFCDQCGEPVARTSDGADQDRRADVTPRDELDPVSGSGAVRKTVTVLFCDLVGSTAFGEQVDAEAAREAIGRYHAMARSAIEDAGGVVEKFIGHGVMALFGVPEMAEDDAHRAVAAGLALHRGFAPIRDAIAERHGPELGLRVGINTGEVVIAEGDADLVGDPINTAARLEAACPPGSVLVGEDTWRLTRSAFPYEVLGDVEVKGKAAPLATYCVASELRDPRPAASTRPHDDDSTPFVGRTTELGQLRRLFEDVERHSRIGLATVVGAPGVGKTRRMREFGAVVVDRVSVVELRFERSGSSTFAPVAELLRSVVDLPDDLSSDEVRRRVHGLVADLLASFVGATPVRSTEEAFFAVRRLLKALGRRSPLVVVIDDVQWVEPLFLDLIERVITVQNEQGPVGEMLADDYLRIDHRPVVGMPPADTAPTTCGCWRTCTPSTRAGSSARRWRSAESASASSSSRSTTATSATTSTT
jgi:class 3 adenylate cyclase